MPMWDDMDINGWIDHQVHIASEHYSYSEPADQYYNQQAALHTPPEDDANTNFHAINTADSRAETAFLLTSNDDQLVMRISDCRISNPLLPCNKTTDIKSSDAAKESETASYLSAVDTIMPEPTLNITSPLASNIANSMLHHEAQLVMNNNATTSIMSQNYATIIIS